MKKIVPLMLSTVLILSANQAQCEDFGLEDTPKPQVGAPTAKIGSFKKAPMQTPKDLTVDDIEDDDTVSYFAQKLNLNIEQMAAAKKLSDEGRLQREALLHSIYALRKQALDFENEEISKFVAILNDNQKKEFNNLLEAQNKRREKMGILSLDIVDKYEDEMARIEAMRDSNYREYEEWKRTRARREQEEKTPQENRNDDYYRSQDYDDDNLFGFDDFSYDTWRSGGF